MRTHIGALAGPATSLLSLGMTPSGAEMHTFGARPDAPMHSGSAQTGRAAWYATYRWGRYGLGGLNAYGRTLARLNLPAQFGHASIQH